MDSIYVAASTGGLAGAFFNQFMQLVHWLFLRPSLDVFFDESVTGCRIVKHDKMWLRVKIYNKSHKTTKSVNVIISNVTSNEGEVYDGKWAGGSIDKLDIPSKEHRFCDVFFMAEGGVPQISSPTNVIRKEFHEDSDVIATISIASDNAPKVSRVVKIRATTKIASTQILGASRL